ncbi:MAG: hypothetical protein KBG20_12850 [Caldilineaceae bacterium]|nr:hypothetical protein [Caldilineaceae bacterium]MBP8107862.1 hypothetical protein [Caldilineaceae bacterium]MBP8122950.1 hypothetical protein [Caldilineaceae bacterium]MBP9073185.1 hypothetical protein [Caldilineaceae bacterium]
MDTNTRRYMRQFIPAMIAYSIVLVAAMWLLDRLGDGSLWRIPVAVLPMIPIGFALRAYLIFLNGADELQRRIQLNGFAFAAGATGMVTLTYGFLENAGFPMLSWVWIFPMIIAFWGIGSAFAERRYK